MAEQRAGRVGVAAWNRVKRGTLLVESTMQARPLRSRRGRRSGGGDIPTSQFGILAEEFTDPSRDDPQVFQFMFLIFDVNEQHLEAPNDSPTFRRTGYPIRPGFGLQVGDWVVVHRVEDYYFLEPFGSRVQDVRVVEDDETLDKRINGVWESYHSGEECEE